MWGNSLAGWKNTPSLFLLHELVLLLLPSPVSLRVSYVSPNGPLLPWEQCAKYWTKALFRSCHWRVETKGHIPFWISPCCISVHFGTYFQRIQTTKLSFHPTPWHTTTALFWNFSFSITAWWTFLLVEENSLLVVPVWKHIPSKKLECVSVSTAHITPWSHGGRLFPFY